MNENGNQEEKAESQRLIRTALQIRESKLGANHKLTQSVRRALMQSTSANWSPTARRRVSSHSSPSPTAGHRYSSFDSSHDSRSPTSGRRFGKAESPHASRSPTVGRHFGGRADSPHASRSPAARRLGRNESQHASRSPTMGRRFGKAESPHSSRSHTAGRRFGKAESPHGSRSPAAGHSIEKPASSTAMRNTNGRSVEKHKLAASNAKGNSSSQRPNAPQNATKNKPPTNLFRALSDQWDEPDDLTSSSPVTDKNRDSTSSRKPNKRQKSKPKKQTKSKTHDHDILRSNPTNTNVMKSYVFSVLWKSVLVIFLTICCLTYVIYFAN